MKNWSPAIVAAELMLLGFITTVRAQTTDTIAPPLPWRAYLVRIDNSMTGKLDNPGTPASPPAQPVGSNGGENLSVSATAHIVFREAPLAIVGSSQVTGKFRIYDEMTYKRTVGAREESLSLRPEARRVLFDRRNGELVFSPDAPLRLTELDLYGTHTAVEALRGLLPPAGHTPGNRWTAGPEAATEIAGLGTIESGSLECVEKESETNQSYKRITVEGVLVGSSPDGRSRNLVSGEVEYDAASGQIVAVTATGAREILSLGDKTTGAKTVGRFDVDYKMTIQPLPSDPELAPEALAKLPVEPTERLTDLEWSDPRLGILFRYPRRWELRVSPAGELLLSQGKSSLVVHVEPENRVPMTNDYLAETKKFLASSNVPAQVSREAREVVSNVGRLGNFQLVGRVESQATILDYWVVQRGTRGVTIAGRLAPEEASRLSEDLQSMARWVRFLSPPQESAQ
jgi:hypothetical protein